MLLAEGALQDRHEELDVELVEAWAPMTRPRRAGAPAHLELATDIYTVESKVVDLRVLSAGSKTRV